MMIFCVQFGGIFMRLLLILLVWTPDVVTTGEAFMMLAFFPVLIILAFAADKGKESYAKSVSYKIRNSIWRRSIGVNFQLFLISTIHQLT